MMKFDTKDGVGIIPEGTTAIEAYAFHGCTSLTSVTIPDSVIRIGHNAFSECRNLTKINIPNSVTAIGHQAFFNCETLTNCIIPEGVTEIGFRSFHGCHSLTSITIPDSVTTIRGSAFSNCKNLAEIIIGSGVRTIGTEAFAYSRNLRAVYCKNTTPPAGGLRAFEENAPGRKIYVPRGFGNAYKTASGFSDYVEDRFDGAFWVDDYGVEEEEVPMELEYYWHLYANCIEETEF